MAALVTNKTQVLALGGSSMTLAAVGGAGGAFPAGGNNTEAGIDNANSCQFLETSGASTTANTHYSAWQSFGGASYDLSSPDQSFIVHFKQQNTTFNTYTSAADSLWLILFSGGSTTNYARWEMNIQEVIDGTFNPLTMTGTPDTTAGTWDNTDVTGWGIAAETNTSGSNFGVAVLVDQLVYINGPVVYEDTGTAATLTIESYYDLVFPRSGETYHSLLNAEIKPVWAFGHPITFETDDLNVSNSTFVFLPNNATKGYEFSTTDYHSLGFIPDSATGSQDLTDCVFAYDSGTYDLTINSTAATSGNVTLTRCSFLNTRDVIIDGATTTLIGCSIPSPRNVTLSDGDIDVQITNSTNAIQWIADLVAGSTITTDSDIDITFAETDLSDINITLTASNAVTVSPTTGSGTYDLSGLTTTGTVTLDNATANDTTIVLPAGTSNTVASPTAGGGAITVDSPATTFTINTNVSALIRIYTTNTQTVLDSATGTSLAFVHSGQTIDYTIEAAGYIPQRFTAEPLSGTTAVTVNLVSDPVYNASHGLTFTTDYSYNAATRVMTIVANQEGRNLYSALIDDFQTETAFRNCPFPLTAIGPDRIDFNAVGYYNSATTVGATIDAGDVQFWKGAGMQWEHSTTGNPTKKFYSIKSSNTLVAGSVVGYTQVLAGTPVEATLVSNQVNQVIQFFEDTNGDGTPDYNYTSHLLFKGFLTGYYQSRWDVVNDGGVTVLEPYEYNISLTQEAIAGTTGNQSVTITTLTDHTGAPITVGGRSFDYELVDPGTTTAENLLAQHNYNVYNAVNTSISGTLYTSYPAFDLPDLLIEAGANYETERGYFEGDGLVTDLSGVYCSRASADHPDITRFQSNDGTYYTPAVTSNITITGLSNDDICRLQITNETAKTASAWAATTAQAQGSKRIRSTGLGTEQTGGLYFVATTAGTTGGTEPTWNTTVGSTTSDGTVTWTTYAIIYYDADPASTGYSDTYFDGQEFATGDTYRIRYADLNTTLSFKTFETTGIVSSTGFSVAASPSSDSVYATNALDGRSVAITNIFAADYSTNYFVLDANLDFTNPKSFAFYCGELTTSAGMYNIWGAVTAIDAGNYLNDVSIADILFDETAGFVKQEDSDTSRWYRSDGTRPFLDPTSGGAGISMNWKNPVFTISTGSVLTAGQQSELTQAAQAAAVNTKIGTPSASVSADIAAIAADVRAEIDANSTQLIAILADTNELQTDWADGGRLDVILDAVPDGTEVADALLIRNLAGGSNGGRTIQDALRSNRNRVEIDTGAGTVTVYAEDDTTVAWTGTATFETRDAISGIDPA